MEEWIEECNRSRQSWELSVGDLKQYSELLGMTPEHIQELWQSSVPSGSTEPNLNCFHDLVGHEMRARVRRGETDHIGAPSET